ncbi:MAG: mechanosensitive ion channel family protein [Eubacteriales bacterium]|nr:mechanosensitive ion channel family protein [Eubacteriales bacterium]
MDKRNTLRLIRNILIAVIGLSLQFVFLTRLQSTAAMQRQHANSEIKLELAAQKLTQNATDADADWAVYDDFLAEKVKTVAWLIDNAEATEVDGKVSFLGVVKNLLEGDQAYGPVTIEEIAARWGLTELYLTDAEGNILTYATGDTTGATLLGSEFKTLKEAGLNRLVKYMNGKNKHPYVTVNNVIYYISARETTDVANSKTGNWVYAVGGIESSEIIKFQDERFTAAYSLRDIRVGDEGFVLAVRIESEEDEKSTETAPVDDGTVLYSSGNDEAGSDDAANTSETATEVTIPGSLTVAYAPDESLIGEDASVLNINAALVPGARGYVDWQGKDWYFENLDTYADKKDYRLVAMIPKDEITAASAPVIWTVMVISILAVLALIIYVMLLQQESADVDGSGKGGSRKASEGKYYRINNKWCLCLTTGKRLYPVAAVALIVLVLATGYMSGLTNVSRQHTIFENKLEDVNATLVANDTRTEALKAAYEAEYTRIAQNVAGTLKMMSWLVEDSKLKKFAEVAGLHTIEAYNTLGEAEATSTNYKGFVLSSDENSQSYPFWDVVKGYRNVFVQDPMPNDAYGEFLQYFGVAREDAPGMIQIAVQPELLKKRLESTEINHVLHNIAIENDGFIFAVDEKSGDFVSYPNEKLIGRDANECGLTDAAQSNGYIGWQKIDGISCFTMTKLHGDNLIGIARPNSSIMKSIIPITLLITVSGLIILVLIVLMGMLDGMDEVTTKNSTQDPNAIKKIFEVTADDGHKRKIVAAADRWDGALLKFHELDATGKLNRIVMYVISGAALLLLIASVTGVAEKSPILSFILSGRWERVISLFSITYVIITSIQILTVSGIIRFVVRRMTRLGSSRIETIGRLVNSFVKYVTAIGVIFYSLQFFGVDTGTLLAGAGILTLIVGLGAQQLVADIMAGLFIVFEGEFRVGDIVTIDGWRGTVEEIGIRTTKIKSPGQDIKIVRNSTISGVINQTRQFSYAVADCGIEYGESLERVEAVLKNELPHIKEHLPAIVDGPFYKGVAALGDSSVVVRIVAQCAEKDRMQLQRDLNRELKLIFDRNDIGIPFPQIVINQPTPKTEATAAEKHAAAKFMADQKEKLQEHPAEPT